MEPTPEEEMISQMSEENLEGIASRHEEPLSFARELENQEALVSDSVEFSCELSRAGLEVIWLKDNQPLSMAEGRFQMINQDNVYQMGIPSVTPDDTGEYTVKVGDLQSTAVLTVNGLYLTN